MRIIIYVMSFFIFSVENAYNENRLFISEKYSQHKKYPNLQARCKSLENDEFAKKEFKQSYIKYMYDDVQVSCLSGLFRENKLDKLKEHIYYSNSVVRLTIFEERLGEKEAKLLPTLLQLLDVIPDKIIIKGGIIYTEADSIVSGIDITETISSDTNSNEKTYTNISTRLPCDPKFPETSNYADLEYVMMGGSDIYAYYNCGPRLKRMKFRLRPEEVETEIIKKIEIPCTLRLHIGYAWNIFFTRLTPILSIDEENLMKKWLSSNIRFDLRFSYICQFITPLQVFLQNQITQYKIFNFTISGYQYKKIAFATPKCIGLTYCLQHYYINNYDYNLEDQFLYKFDKTKVTYGGKR